MSPITGQMVVPYLLFATPTLTLPGLPGPMTAMAVWLYPGQVHTKAAQMVGICVIGMLCDNLSYFLLAAVVGNHGDAIYLATLAATDFLLFLFSLVFQKFLNRAASRGWILLTGLPLYLYRQAAWES